MSFSRVYITSQQEGGLSGIWLCHFDGAEGKLRAKAVFRDGMEYPHFLISNARHTQLFAAGFSKDSQKKITGSSICAYAIDEETGRLKSLNTEASGGIAPCFLEMSRNEKFLLSAHYIDGHVAVHPVLAEGGLKPASHVVLPAPHEMRKAHAHSIVLDAANRFAVCADLGLNEVVSYRFDAQTGALARQASWKAHGNAGPRHFRFHPNGRMAYLINEYANTLVSFAYDAEGGTLRELQTLETLPENYTGENYCADLHVHPSGRFLYGSNRGHDSVVACSIDASSGHLAVIGHEPTQGNFPRSMAVDPSGRFLLVGNERSHTVVAFQINAKSGKLTPAGCALELPGPTSICFA